MKPNCNNCNNRECPYTYTIKDPETRKKRLRQGMMKWEASLCKLRIYPKSGWSLAELSLAYPQGLNDALQAMPFKVNLGFYLPR